MLWVDGHYKYITLPVRGLASELFHLNFQALVEFSCYRDPVGENYKICKSTFFSLPTRQSETANLRSDCALDTDHNIFTCSLRGPTTLDVITYKRQIMMSKVPPPALWLCIFNYHLCLSIIIYVLVGTFRFIWIPMLWVYGHYKYFNSSSEGTDCIRQNLTSTDRLWRKKTVPALKGLMNYSLAQDTNLLIIFYPYRNPDHPRNLMGLFLCTRHNW